jgi:hypothetical protein
MNRNNLPKLQIMAVLRRNNWRTADFTGGFCMGQKNWIVIIAFMSLIILASCWLLSDDIEDEEKHGNKEPAYTTKIAWVSDTRIERFHDLACDGDSVYAFEDVENQENDYDNFLGFRLVKIDARTGSVLWRTGTFSAGIQLRPALIIDDYVYVFIDPSYIYSYSNATGELSAIVQMDAGNAGFLMTDNAQVYENYFYFGFRVNPPYTNYFARFDITTIDRTKEPSVPQQIAPELVWQPTFNLPVNTVPVFKDGVVYCSAQSPTGDRPVELVGIEIAGREIVFRQLLDFDRGRDQYGLLLQDDVIYCLFGTSVSAYNINTNEKVFLHTFHYTLMPPEAYYGTGDFPGEGALYYEDKIYYTNNMFKRRGNYKNIICIDAKTGNLVWSDIPQETESLGTNPIIAHGKMYVPHGYGLRVYNPDNGELIGVDTSFWGSARTLNALYNNYMLTIRYDNNTGIGKVVAIDVSK